MSGQYTQDTKPMLAQCLSSFAEDGPIFTGLMDIAEKDSTGSSILIQITYFNTFNENHKQVVILGFICT